MAAHGLAILLHRVRDWTARPAAAGDGFLLHQFLTTRDEAAFAALVERHGPMVAGVCRRALHDPADADDVFQATFVVLVRRAAAIRKGDSIGSWLHGVA